MKSIIRKLLIACAGVLLMASCKKVENKVVFKGGSAPVLSASLGTGATIPLVQSTKEATAINFSWTNPNYEFNTGVNSQNVNYTLQIDKPGNNFSGSTLQEKSYSSSLNDALTQGNLNKMLLALGLPFDQEATFEVRIKSSLGDGSVPLYSNVLTFKATPFLDVLVPIPTTGELYLVGGGPKLNGWQNGGAFAVQNQKFTQIDITTYSITVELAGGNNQTDANQFLFIPKWGDWSHKYACKETAKQDPAGGEFVFDYGQNFPGPPEAGTYKIVVDFIKGKYTVTKQ